MEKDVDKQRRLRGGGEGWKKYAIEVMKYRKVVGRWWRRRREFRVLKIN